MNKDIRGIFKLYENLKKAYTFRRPEGIWEYAPQWEKNDKSSYWWHLVIPPEAVSGSVWMCDISGLEEPDPEMIRKWLALGQPTRNTYGTDGALTKKIIDDKYKEYESALKSDEHDLNLNF